MALTDEQRAELEALGPETVRAKLIRGGGASKGAAIPGFYTGPFQSLPRGDIEDWLAEQHIKEKRVQQSTLRWARIAGCMAILSVGVTIVGIVVTVWLTK